MSEVEMKNKVGTGTLKTLAMRLASLLALGVAFYYLRGEFSTGTLSGEVTAEQFWNSLAMLVGLVVGGSVVIALVWLFVQNKEALAEIVNEILGVGVLLLAIPVTFMILVAILKFIALNIG